MSQEIEIIPLPPETKEQRAFREYLEWIESEYSTEKICSKMGIPADLLGLGPSPLRAIVPVIKRQEIITQYNLQMMHDFSPYNDQERRQRLEDNEE